MHNKFLRVLRVLCEKPVRAARSDTAAVMRHLDLVITSDPAIAHLAGALGVRVWLALARGADWRWLSEPEESPWYPTMRLFRQRQWGCRQEVFQQLSAEIVEQRYRQVKGEN